MPLNEKSPGFGADWEKYLGQKIFIKDPAFNGEWEIISFSDEKQQYFLNRISPFTPDDKTASLTSKTWVDRATVEELFQE